MTTVPLPPSPLPPPERDVHKQEQRKLAVSVLLVSVLAHIGVGVVAATVIIAYYLEPPPATFVAKKSIVIPPKIQEEKMAAAEYEAAAAKPAFDDRLASMRPAEFALPDLPPMPVEDMMPLEPNTLVTDNVSALVGAAGSGAGGDGDGGIGDGGFSSGVSFLGIKDTARGVVIAFDISQSVVTAMQRSGMDILKIKEETKTLIQGLGINTRFNLVQFARNYDAFAPQMVPASDANKQAALEWLDTEFKTDGKSGGGWSGAGRGIQVVMEAVFKMQPDVIFLLSDASFQRSGPGQGENVPWDELDRDIENFQKALPMPARLHFVGFSVNPGNWKEVRRLTGRHDGKAREFK